MSSEPRQTKIRATKPGKREATRRWQETREAVRQLEEMETGQATALKATREALKIARSNASDAADELSELLDAELPALPGGGLDAPATIPQT